MLRRFAPDIAASIPEAPRIIAFRNVLIHQYAAVDDGLVWSVVKSKIPEMQATLRKLLGDDG